LSFRRADYLQMLHFGSCSMDMMLWQIRAHEHLLPAHQRDARTIKRYQRKFVTEVEPQLKGRLEAAPYICGENFTAADCIIGHNVIWARAYGLCYDDTFRYYQARISSRPAFLRAYSDFAGMTAEIPGGNRVCRETFSG